MTNDSLCNSLLSYYNSPFNVDNLFNLLVLTISSHVIVHRKHTSDLASFESGGSKATPQQPFKPGLLKSWDLICCRHLVRLPSSLFNRRPLICRLDYARLGLPFQEATQLTTASHLASVPLPTSPWHFTQELMLTCQVDLTKADNMSTNFIAYLVLS